MITNPSIEVPPTTPALIDSNHERTRVIIISILAGIFILVLKFLAYLMTGSMALKSDAIESIVNVAAAIFALGAVIFSNQPADKTHPYGHGKIEHFSAAFEGGLITLAAALIIFESIHNLIEGVKLQSLNLGVLVNFSAGVFNGFLGWFLVRSGKKHNSKALEADGWHVLSDFYTTVGIGIALIVVKITGLYWLDPVIAIFVALILAGTGFKLVHHSSSALLDKEDPEMVDTIVRVINQVRTPDIIAIHELRTLRSGRYTHVDLHIVVPEYYSTAHSHDLVEQFGKKIIATGALKDGKLEGECHTHIDPCRKLFCAACAMKECPIREKSQASQGFITVEHATSMGPF